MFLTVCPPNPSLPLCMSYGLNVNQTLVCYNLGVVQLLSMIYTSSKYGKLGPRGKKNNFVRYSDVSKGYVFVGEQDNGLTIEFESEMSHLLKMNFLS